MGHSKNQEAPLDLLEQCTNEDLDPLVQYIIRPPNINNRLDTHERFKIHRPNHQKYVDVIASEIRAYGGQTLANLARGGEGPHYREIVRDVAIKVGVTPKPTKEAAIEEMELEILKKLLESAYKEMSEEEQQEVLRTLSEGQGGKIPWEAGVPLFAILAQAGIQLSGFVAYQTAVVVANAVARFLLGRGLALAVNAGIARAVSLFAGPIGWVLSGLWLVIDLLGPAYRVTIPCVVHIAYLRQKMAFDAAGGEKVP